VIEQEALALEPSNIELYGILTKWLTTVDEIPTGLEVKDFKD